MRLTSWDVSTLCPGLSQDLYQVDDANKTAIINHELRKLNIDISALLETKRPSNGSSREQNCTFCWQENEPDENRLHGVGFPIREPDVSAKNSFGTLCRNIRFCNRWSAETSVSAIVEVRSECAETSATDVLNYMGWIIVSQLRQDQ